MAKQELQGYCPNCSCPITYYEGEQVRCNSCDNTVTPRSSWEAERKVESDGAAAIMVGLDNPESALVYLENYYENFNWDEFAKTADLFPTAVKEMVEKNKIKNGASANAWLLAFKSEAFPIFQKTEGLKKLEREMAEKYNPKNNDAVLKLFDAYKRVAKVLDEKKDEIVKRLESYVRYAERFNLDANTLAQVKTELDNIAKSLAAVKTVEKLLDLPVYFEAKKAADKKNAAEFFARGIDAEAVYKDALAKMNDPSAPKEKIVESLESIRGYSDAADYIKKLNKYYNFHGEFFDYMGKKFIFKKEKNVLEVGGIGKKGCSPFGKKKAKEKAAAAQAEAIATAKLCYSLYAIEEDGHPGKKPLIKGINQIIGCYAGRIYFYQNREGIAFYDFATDTVEVVDKGKDEDYLTAKGEYEAYFNGDQTGFCFKKRLAFKNEKTGCLKKKTKNVRHENNYALYYIDMRNNSVKTYVEELVDISDIYENTLFYTYATVVYPEKKKGCGVKIAGFINGIKKIFGKGKPEEYKVESSLHVCDLSTGETKQLLDEGCQIFNVVDDKIIYSVFAPNPLNLDLHVYNIKTGEVSVVEKNIYDYFTTADGYIYYTIGNDWYQPLVRNNFEGTDRLEVMRNVTKIVGQSGGWIYLKKGKGRNAVLTKLSVDGKEKVFLCSQFDRVVLKNDTLIYYINSNGALCSVRTDGREAKVVSENISKIVAIGQTAIFFTVEEKVDRRRTAESMYSIDIDGANTVKLVFDVTDTDDYDEDYFYYSKREDVRYKVTVPVSKTKTETEYRYYTTTEYFKYNKNTGDSELVLTLGLPDAKAEYKTGCIFKKTVEGQVIFEKYPEVVIWERTDLEKAGAVNDTQVEEEAQANAVAAIKAKLGGKNGKGCVVLKGVGCVFAILAAIPIIGKLFKPFAGKKKK